MAGRYRRTTSAALFACLLLAAAAALGCARSTDLVPETPTAGVRPGPVIRIAAFDFEESRILAEIYAQQLEAMGFAVDRTRTQPGTPREELAPAVEAGEVDFLLEYVGTLLRSLGGEPTSDGESNRRAAAQRLAPRGVTVLDEAPEAENVNALVIPRVLSESLDITRVSDLTPHAATLTLGGPPECPERDFCLVGLREVYGIEFGAFVPLEFEARVAALQEGEVDVAVLFSTDATIYTNDWVVLADDMDLQPAENVAPVVRTAIVEAYGDEFVQAVNAVTAKLTRESLAEMNADYRVDGREIPLIARTWLFENDFIEVE